jgi:hypothetical protein
MLEFGRSEVPITVINGFTIVDGLSKKKSSQQGSYDSLARK